MFSQIGTNDMTSFKEYLEEESDQVNEMVSLVRYQYSVSPLIYTVDATDSISQLNPSTLMSSISGMSSASSLLSPESGWKT